MWLKKMIFQLLMNYKFTEFGQARGGLEWQGRVGQGWVRRGKEWIGKAWGFCMEFKI